MALIDLIERVRTALAVSSDYDAQIEAGIKSAGRRLLRDYNFPKQITKLTYPLVAAGSQYLELPGDFKKSLAVRLSQFEEQVTFWSEPFERAESFVLPSGDGVPRKYWIEGNQLWLNSAMPSEGLDVVLWYQSSGWDENAAWLLADQEDTLFYFAMTRLAPEMRKKEVFEVFAPLWSDERQSLAIYLNELEWDDVTILMREPQNYITSRTQIEGLGSPSIFSLYGRAFVQIEDAEGARALLELGQTATFDILPVENGGTGASDIPGAQLSLGLRPGVEVQAFDADLAAIASLVTTSFGRGFLTLADNAAARSYLSLGTLAVQSVAPIAMGGTGQTTATAGFDALAGVTSTAFGRGFNSLADIAAGRTKLSLTPGTDVQTYDSDLAAIAALTTTAFGRGFLDLADNAAARSKLSLGSAAVQNIGTSGTVVAMLSGTNVWGAQQDFSPGTLGAISGNELLATRYNWGVGANVCSFTAKARRYSNGSDWTTAVIRLQAFTDATAQGFIEFNPPGASQHGLAFGTGPGATEQVRIDGSGNVGIGTASPEDKLHLTGWLRFNNNLGMNFKSSTGVFTSGTAGGMFQKGSDNHFYIDNYDGSFYFRGAGYAQRMALDSVNLISNNHIIPATDNNRNLGSGSLRFATVFAGTGAINTSDRNSKDNIQAINDTLLDAWANVNWQAFQFKDALEEKGPDQARWHFGLIAQDVRDAIDQQMGAGTALRLGLVCYDEWEERRDPASEAAEVVYTFGVPISPLADTDFEEEEVSIYYTYEETRIEEVRIEDVVTPAGYRWGLRYDECQALEAAYQRRRMDRIEAKLEAMA